MQYELNLMAFSLSLKMHAVGKGMSLLSLEGNLILLHRGCLLDAIEKWPNRRVLTSLCDAAEEQRLSLRSVLLERSCQLWHLPLLYGHAMQRLSQ